MVEKQLNELIKESFPSLSPGQKKVAEFIKSHMDEGALHTAYQIGKRAGVSETTVIRLAYTLGFTGFSDLQEKIRKDWLEDKHSYTKEVSATAETSDENQLFERVIEHEKSILQQLLQQIRPEELSKTIDCIIRADRVYIGGFGSSYAAAYWLFYSLRQFRENIYLSSPNGFMPEEVSELSEHSIMMVFAFPRYRKETLKLVNLAKKQKATVVAITNRQLSPVGQLADITLTTEEHIESSHNSIASVISLLEVLMAGIQKEDKDRISRRQQKLEQLYADQGLFIE